MQTSLHLALHFQFLGWSLRQSKDCKDSDAAFSDIYESLTCRCASWRLPVRRQTEVVATAVFKTCSLSEAFETSSLLAGAVDPKPMEVQSHDENKALPAQNLAMP